jgi:hypothetical protein
MGAGRQPTAAQAGKVAMEECMKNQGATSCKVVVTITSGCGYLTTGQSRKNENVLGYGFGDDLNSALTSCRAKGLNCPENAGHVQKCALVPSPDVPAKQ